MWHSRHGKDYKTSYSYNYVGVPVMLVEIYLKGIDPLNLIWLRPAKGTYSLALSMVMRSSVVRSTHFFVPNNCTCVIAMNL